MDTKSWLDPLRDWTANVKDNDPMAKTSVPFKCNQMYFNTACNEPVCRNNDGTWSKLCQKHKDAHARRNARCYERKKVRGSSSETDDDIEDGEVGICKECEGPVPRLKNGKGWRQKCNDCTDAATAIYAMIANYKKKRRMVETIEERSVRPKLMEERALLQNRMVEIEVELQVEDENERQAMEEFEIAKSNLLSIL